MADRKAIAPGMEVLTADGELLGTVADETREGFMLRRMGGRDKEETIPDMWVARVDDHVHLNRTGAEAIAGWKSLQFTTSSGERPAAPVRDDRRERTGASWLLWALLAVAAIAIIAWLAMGAA